MKMKKILSVILAAVMLLGCMSFTAFAENEPTTTTITWESSDYANSYCLYSGSANNTIKGITLSFSATGVKTALSHGFDGSNNYMQVQFGSEEPVKEAVFTFTSSVGKISKIEINCGHYEFNEVDSDWSVIDEDSHDSKATVKWEGTPADSVDMTIRESNFTSISNITSFVFTVEEPEDPSGVDLSMLTTGKKIMLGTYASGDNQGKPVEWVIGGDGTEDCMSVPEGCIALVTSDVVASGITFGDDNVYSTSNVKSAVESAVTFSTDEQAAIQERTLQGTLDGLDKPSKGVAGSSVTAKVWAPTQTDALLLKMNSLTVSSDYWLCSLADDQYTAAYVSGETIKPSEPVIRTHGVRAGLYLDLSKVYGATAVEGKTDTYTLDLTAPSTFLTSFTLSKDYDDKYNSGNKTTAVNETVTYTITAISTGDDVPAFTSSTFTIGVTDGAGSADVALPTTITKAGDYWYSITETGGKTAGVTYDTNTYYLHLITDCKGGEFGVLSAQIHKTAPDLTKTDYEDQFVNEASDKITSVSNSYGEGKLKITQDTTVDGADNDYDEFEVTVTFTLPEGTEITGNITYGDQTIEPDDWTTDDSGVTSVTVTVTLKDNEYVEFDGIPDGTTYTVEQTDSNTDLGFGDPDFTIENGETDEDTVVTDEATGKKSVTGTISDGEDDITVANEMTTPVDVGVILENGAFILLALGAIVLGAWLVISKRRKALDAE